MHALSSQRRPINLILHSQSLQQICRSTIVVISILQVNGMIFSTGAPWGPNAYFFFFQLWCCQIVLVPLIHKSQPDKNLKVIWASKGSANIEIYLQTEISLTLAQKKTKTENACSSCLRVFEAKSGRGGGGGFLGGNRGITVDCHTPKYSAYRDINRSRRKTDQQSCGLSGSYIRPADARTRSNIDHAAWENEHQQIWSPQLIDPQQCEGGTAAGAGI